MPACRPRLGHGSLSPPDTLSQRHCQGPGRAPKWGPGHGPGGKWVGLAPAPPPPGAQEGGQAHSPGLSVSAPLWAPLVPPPPQAPTRRQTHPPANPHEAGEHLATAQVCALPPRREPGAALARSRGAALTICGLQCSPRAPWLAALRHPRTQAALARGLTCGCSGCSPAGTRAAGGLVRTHPMKFQPLVPATSQEGTAGGGHSPGAGAWGGAPLSDPSPGP